MSTEFVYYTSIDYQYEKGSVDYGKFSGGLVFMFVKACDVRDALAKFEAELAAVHLSAQCVEFIDKYENEDWETAEQQANYDALAKEASNSNEVVCDSFFAYED